MTPSVQLLPSLSITLRFFSQGDNNGNSPIQIMQFLKAVFFRKESVVF